MLRRGARMNNAGKEGKAGRRAYSESYIHSWVQIQK
jgi:hypothetical protein